MTPRILIGIKFVAPNTKESKLLQSNSLILAFSFDLFSTFQT
jgi:hypothetical protein